MLLVGGYAAKTACVSVVGIETARQWAKTTGKLGMTCRRSMFGGYVGYNSLCASTYLCGVNCVTKSQT